MFGNKELKQEVESIRKMFVKMASEMTSEINELKEDYDDYLEWRKMRDANEQAAATMGHFYITADDTALLEKLIQECNKDKDLAVLLTTAQGTTLSLRSHPQPQVKDNFINYKKFNEEEK